MSSLIHIPLFFITISILYTLRKIIQQRIQSIVLLLGGSKKAAITMYSIIVLPGVIIHELSHFFAALITGVRTGAMSIFPDFSDELGEGRISLGSVKIAKTDFLRGSFIGAAPFFVGCTILYITTQFMLDNIVFTSITSFTHSLGGTGSILPLGIWVYASFVVGNTMFSSKEDTRAFPVVGVLLLIPTITLILANKVSLLIEGFALPLAKILTQLNASFLLVIIINLLVAIIMWSIQRLTEKISGKKIIYS